MDVLTAGDVGKICKVGPQTVHKWIDSGLLRGWRIPGSLHRRTTREFLIDFLKKNGMPLGDLAVKKNMLLIVGVDLALESAIKYKLPGAQVDRVAVDYFTPDNLMKLSVPTAIVIDTCVGLQVADRMCGWLTRDARLSSVPVFIVAEQHQVITEIALSPANVFYHPFDVELLATCLKSFFEESAA